MKGVSLLAGRATYLATYEANDVQDTNWSEFDATSADDAAREICGWWGVQPFGEAGDQRCCLGWALRVQVRESRGMKDNLCRPATREVSAADKSGARCTHRV